MGEFLITWVACSQCSEFSGNSDGRSATSSENTEKSGCIFEQLQKSKNSGNDSGIICS